MHFLLSKKWTLLALLAVIVVLIYGAVSNRKKDTETMGNHTYGNRQLPIYCVETDKKQIAITFDAAWGNEDTTELLEILASKNVPATFFVTGEWVNKYPESLKEIADAGHEIGNHSANHKYMSKLSAKEIEEEILSVKKAADAITGKDMCVFRPPYGDYDDLLINTAMEIGFYTIQWDVDSLDWKDYGAKSIVDTVVNHKHLGNGSIILCHNGAKYTKNALGDLLDKLIEEGYEFVTVSELIYKDNYHINAEGRQIKE